MGKYCSECGTLLTERELKQEGRIPFCTKCNEFRFPLFNVAVSMIVVNRSDGNILLIQQYGKKTNVLVAGYVNRGESAEHAVIREVKEETGMTVSFLHFNRTHFFEPSNTLMCNFTAFVENDLDFNANDEIDDFHWYSPVQARKEIRPESLASYFLNAYLDEAEQKGFNGK